MGTAHACCISSGSHAVAGPCLAAVSTGFNQLPQPSQLPRSPVVACTTLAISCRPCEVGHVTRHALSLCALEGRAAFWRLAGVAATMYTFHSYTQSMLPRTDFRVLPACQTCPLSRHLCCTPQRHGIAMDAIAHAVRSLVAAMATQPPGDTHGSRREWKQWSEWTSTMMGQCRAAMHAWHAELQLNRCL